MDKQALHSRINSILELPEEEFDLLMQYAVLKEIKKGDALLKEGDICKSFYLVDTGFLRTYYDKEGMDINLAFTFEGEFTTNLKSYRSKQASEITIEAGEKASVYVFDLAGLQEKYRQHPDIARFIRRLALRLLLASEDYSNLFRISTPTERYRYIEEQNPRLLQRISLSQLASYLGVTRETLSRIRSKRD
jgi:CRP-like cAMP-binding protein